MKNFRNLSIRLKQTLIIMLTSSIALLLACAAFITYDTIAFRNELVEKESSVAQVIGTTATAALDFNDRKTAEESLAALQAEPNIVAACIYNREGQVFATYQRGAGQPAFTFPPVQAAGHEFKGEHLHLFRLITQGNETVGTIFIASDLTELSERMVRYAGIVVLVFGASLLIAFAVSSRLQRVVSNPILHLAQVARTVAHDKNYAVRALKQNEDELGQLIDGFNEMLTQIQQRDMALQAARETLELRVAERTGELARSLSLLNATIESTTDGILAIDLAGQITSFNSKFAAIWEFPADLLERRNLREFAAYEANQVKDTDKFLLRVAASSSQPERDVFDVFELKDGRVFERYAVPQRIDHKCVGVVVNWRDVTGRKQAEAELARTHRQLLDTSRAAGMAEVASNVLHNVGNVLNSVNVSATLVADNMKKSKATSLGRVVALLDEHTGDLGTFITSDSKGKQLPNYLRQLSEHVRLEQQTAVEELDSLRKNIEHIKEIVAMQQSYAKVSGQTEVLNVTDLIEDSLRMNAGALTRHDVAVVRDYQDVPPINVEKHKVLQILVNLIRNAKYACDEGGQKPKLLTIRLFMDANWIKIAVSDNGIGIPAENLTRIFNHGFTTRKEGHGFGLHSGALAAKEMGGALNVQSAGPGQGATFTLELPRAKS